MKTLPTQHVSATEGPYQGKCGDSTLQLVYLYTEVKWSKNFKVSNFKFKSNVKYS